MITALESVRVDHFSWWIQRTGVPDAVAILLIHGRNTDMWRALVLAHVNIVCVGRSQHTETIEDEVAEFVVYVCSTAWSLIRSDEDVSLGELFRVRDCKVPGRSKRLWPLSIC